MGALRLLIGRLLPLERRTINSTTYLVSRRVFQHVTSLWQRPGKQTVREIAMSCTTDLRTLKTKGVAKRCCGDSLRGNGNSTPLLVVCKCLQVVIALLCALLQSVTVTACFLSPATTLPAVHYRETPHFRARTASVQQRLYSTGDDDNNCLVWEDGELWTLSSSSWDNEQAAAAAANTWRWCADFVVPLALCPWAAASVHTKGALRIYLAKRNDMKGAIKEAAFLLRNDVEADLVDPNVAIAFVVCSPCEHNWDFFEFLEWFEELEESFDNDFVTLAPFHPEWQFGGGPVEHFFELDFEKQSPHPTVSIVCTSVIDKAGPVVTDQIANHNERVLLDMGVSELQRLYQTRVFPEDAPS